jgi:hypothetical protein
MDQQASSAAVLSPKSYSIKNYEAYFKRHEINEQDLSKKYDFHPKKQESFFYGTQKYLKNHYKPSLICFKNYTFDRLPILKWILDYNVKEDFVKDLVGGLTLGIIQIPGGLCVAFFQILF